MTSETEVAVKVTHGEGVEQVRRESKLLTRKFKGKCDFYVDFPEVIWQGHHNGSEIQVMQLLGPCLLDVFLTYNRFFTDKTLCILGINLITAVEILHSTGYLHRDIKPDNICIGNESEVFLIDFGLVKKFRSKGKHLPCKAELHLQGNCYWTSSNTLRGITASRRDDLESLFYILLYFSKGSLPWYKFDDGLDCSPSTILSRRSALSITQICAGALPVLSAGFAYIRALDYDSEPRYEYLRGLFRDYMYMQGWKCEEKYDWEHVKFTHMTSIDISESAYQNSTRSSPRKRTNRRKRTSSSTTNKECNSGESVEEKVTRLNNCEMRSPGALLNGSNSTRRPTEAKSSGDIADFVTGRPMFALNLRPVQCTEEPDTPKAASPLRLHSFRSLYTQYKFSLQQ